MNQQIKLTLLVDNQVSEGLVAEHGFALWVEAGDQRILLDTGAGMALLPNAAALGIDLSQANALVLSHGHYDHTGGIANFLVHNDQAKIYFGQAMAVPRFSCHSGVAPRAIGIAADNYQALLKLASDRVHELHAPVRLAPGIGITGPIPRRHDFEDTGGPFFLDDTKQRIDMISDDLALWLETTKGLVIITGCCHSGLLNTIYYIQQISGKERVCGIIGGLHLLHASTERMKMTILGLSGLKLDFLSPSHCTGSAQTSALQGALGGDVVMPGFAGMSISLRGL